MKLKAKLISMLRLHWPKENPTFHYRWHVEAAIHNAESVTEVCVRSGGSSLWT